MLNKCCNGLTIKVLERHTAHTSFNRKKVNVTFPLKDKSSRKTFKQGLKTCDPHELSTLTLMLFNEVKAYRNGHTTESDMGELVTYIFEVFKDAKVRILILLKTIYM